jgi:hypothetical protein
MEPVYFNTHFHFECYTWDIPHFDGEYDHIIDIASIKWTKQHIPVIQTYLRDVRNKYDYPELDITIFSFTIDGTQELVDVLRRHSCALNYIFAYAVYHQLLYCDPLEGVYETGLPPGTKPLVK